MFFHKSWLYVSEEHGDHEQRLLGHLAVHTSGDSRVIHHTGREGMTRESFRFHVDNNFPHPLERNDKCHSPWTHADIKRHGDSL